jgi:hypothetical protein
MAEHSIQLWLNHKLAFCECVCLHACEIHYFMKYLLFHKQSYS